MSFSLCLAHQIPKGLAYYCLHCNKCVCEDCECVTEHENEIVSLAEYLEKTLDCIGERLIAVQRGLQEEIAACKEGQCNVTRIMEVLESALGEIGDESVRRELISLQKEVGRTNEILKMRVDAVTRLKTVTGLKKLEDLEFEDKLALYTLERERPQMPFVPRKSLRRIIQERDERIARLEFDVEERNKEIKILEAHTMSEEDIISRLKHYIELRDNEIKELKMHGDILADELRVKDEEIMKLRVSVRDSENIIVRNKQDMGTIAEQMIRMKVNVKKRIILLRKQKQDIKAKDEEIERLRRELNVFKGILNCEHKGIVEIPNTYKVISVFKNEDKTKILVIPKTINSIPKNALWTLHSLRAIVVDKISKCVPENCDFGAEEKEPSSPSSSPHISFSNDDEDEEEVKQYRHVPVFRIDTAHPPLISLPDTVFKTEYDIPVLIYATAEQAIKIGDKTLEASGNGFEMQTVQLDAGEYTVDDVAITVVEWNEIEGCGVPEDARDGSVDLRVPYGVEVVGEKQYFENKKLRSVYIPPTVKMIGEYAFYECSNLTRATFNGVREIGIGVFYRSGLTRVTIPGSVDRVGGWSFNSCKSLTLIVMNEGVQSIEDYAFSLSPLTSVHIPSSVKYMGRNPFAEIHSLTTITSFSPHFRVEKGTLTDVEDGRLIVSVGRENEYIVPEGIRVIGECAFYGRKELEDVIFSSTVEEIRDSAFESTGLTHVTIPGNVGKIGGWIFNKCESLTMVKLNEGLELIGKGAFESTPLRALTIPSTVVSITGNPFNDCKQLTLGSNNKRFVVTERGEFVDMEEGRLITYFFNNKAEEYIVSGCVNTIGWWAAANNPYLKTVRLHKNIEDVEEHAFDNCTNLATFIVPEGMRSLIEEGKIFKNSKNVTVTTVPLSSQGDRRSDAEPVNNEQSTSSRNNSDTAPQKKGVTPGLIDLLAQLFKGKK